MENRELVFPFQAIHNNPSMKSMNSRGRIFNIQHFSLHDGPGIRTTVFFKGCPLNCIWCHNPEGIDHKIALSFDILKCIGCLACVKKCPAVHKTGENGHFLNRKECKICGGCAGVCVTHALEMVGRDLSAEEILPELLQDRPFYENSGGGVTISGGEPVLQGDFLLDLALSLKKENIHVALETSGFCDFKTFLPLLPYVDLFLYDYKETNPELHKKFTGVTNELILENLEKLYDQRAKIFLRCPVIPGLNDRDDHFQGIADLLKKYPDIEGVELLPYHNLGYSKADRIGIEVQKDFIKPSEEKTNEWIERVRSFGGRIHTDL